MQVVLWILAALTTTAAGYFTYRADVARAVPRPWLTAALRAIVIALVWLLLLAPAVPMNRQETQPPVIVVLQDESASIPASLRGDTAGYRTKLNALTARLRGQYRVVSWGFGTGIQRDSLFRYRQPATDISMALSGVQEFYGQQNLGAVLLATDGRFNQGMHPLFQNLALHSPLYTIAVGDTSISKDLRISRTYSNRTAALNSQFEIRADIVATGASGYHGAVQLLEGNAQLQRSELQITADQFDKAVSFTVKAATAGLHHYVVVVPAMPGEANTSNNRRDVFVEVVEEKKNILLLSAAPHPDIAAIQEALAGLDMYHVTVRTAVNMPSLNDYGVVILHGIPGNGISLPAGFNKPVWYIVSSGSGASLPENAGRLNINPGVQHDVYAAVNASFSAFNLPTRTNAVLDRLPPLSVPVGNVQPGVNAQAVFYQKGSTIPVWFVQPGLVPRAVLMGEGLWRWRLYEYRYFHNHEVTDEYIRQTVALLAANVQEQPFRATLPKHEWSEGEPVLINAYLLNASNEQINTPDATLVLKDSAGRTQSFSFERNGNAYRLNTGILPGGTYTYTARTGYNGKAYTASGSFVVSGTPLELAETGADYPLLYALARKYSGQVVPAAYMASLYDSLLKNDNIRPVIRTRDESLPLVDWKWYFFLILLVATTEWLLRKYWLAQ